MSVFILDFFLSPPMVSSLDNWDGSLSNTVEEQPSRITNLLNNNADGTSTLNKTTDERINTLGIRQGWQDMVTSLDVNRTVCCLSDCLCILAQVAICLVRRVNFESIPIARQSYVTHRE